MATWKPFRDVNNNGFRTEEFTASGTNIAAFVPVVFDTSASYGYIKAAAAVTDNLVGITAEAITASTAGQVWTSGIFYSSTGAGGTIKRYEPLVWAAATTVLASTTSAQNIWGFALNASTSGAALYWWLISCLDAGRAPSP